MPETFEKSEKIANRFIEIVNNNDLIFSHELKIIEVLFKKFELVTVQDYAQKTGKSYNGIQDMIKRSKLATIEISGKIFILKNLN
jgi:hypothetical protein